MDVFHVIVGVMRPRFLTLGVVCFLLGTGTAVYEKGLACVHLLPWMLILAGSLLAPSSVHAFNEYLDFKCGLDLKTKRTPFSGGTGTLPKYPALAAYALGTAFVTLFLTCAIGLYFVWTVGTGLLSIGLMGIVMVVAYSPWFTKSPPLALVSSGLGFGVAIVMGTHFVLTGGYSWSAFVASLVPFFLVNNILLLNQFPDVEADRCFGRRNFPIVIGRKKCSLIYGVFLAGVYLSIVAGVMLKLLPPGCLLALVTMAIGVPAFVGAYRHADEIEKLHPYLGYNAQNSLVTPILMTVGLLIG